MIARVVAVAGCFLATRVLAFDDATFCIAMKEYAAEANKDVGSLVDRLARDDGVSVLCHEKVVSFNKSLVAEASQMRDGWQAHQQSQWNQAYCSSFFSEAIKKGWQFTLTLTTVDGQKLSFQTECK